MMFKVLMMFVSAVFMLCGGCSLLAEKKYTPVAAYSLTFDGEAASPAHGGAQILQVRNLTPTARRMLYYHADGRISGDEYNQWVQTPENMVRNMILRSYASGKTAVPDLPVRVNIEIFRFELNTVDSTAYFGAAVNISRTGGGIRAEKRYMIETSSKWTQNTPEARVRAMSEAVNGFIRRLDGCISQYSGKN